MKEIKKKKGQSCLCIEKKKLNRKKKRYGHLHNREKKLLLFTNDALKDD
jgi:hypothetical protein